VAQRGFSLLGVIVMLAAICVVAGMALPVVAAGSPRTRVDETRAELRALVPAIQSYFWDCRRLPASFTQLQANSPRESGWKGPYLTPLLSARPGVDLALDRDAWNQAYVVTVTSTGAAWTPASTTSSITITSRGQDRTLRTADDLEQIVDVTYLRSKETADEIRILDNSIAAYNALHLEKAPLPPDLDRIFTALYDARLLPRPTGSHVDGLKTDGWGSAYVPLPGDGSPVTSVTSANL
jgi:type II secretory pathway pseudopilin PulG